jgi:hypothetical protein
MPKQLFKKGQSGNPSGKPKGAISLVSGLRRRLSEHPEEIDEIVSQWIALALSGDLKAIITIVEYIDGKVVLPLSNPDGTPIKVLVEYVNPSNKQAN